MRHDWARSSTGTKARGWAGGSFVLALSVIATGCVGKRIVVVDPDDGLVSLGVTDDLDAQAAGLQYDVVVDTVDMPIGERITVFVGTDESTVTSDGFPYEGAVQPNGRATVRATLPDGEVFLVACAGEGCAHRSPTRRVTVDGSSGRCPLVQFLAPAGYGSGSLVLDGASDTATSDGACGPEFATKVRARAQVADGTLARLFVDGLPVAQAYVQDAIVDFGDVTLGVRGTDTSTLAISLEDQPASCVLDHPRPISVGCSGDSCRLVPPTAGLYLNGSLDAVPTSPTLELDVRATSTLGALGDTFTLLVDGSPASTALGVSASGGVRGDFLGAPIPSGDTETTLQAVCPSGATTIRSARARYAVDTVPCTVELLAPTDGKVFLTAEDLDGNTANGMQVDASIRTVGADCVGYRVAVCSALTATPMTDFAGDASGVVLATIATLGTSGTQELCAQAVDFAGNVSTDTITVGVAPQGPPSVAVVDPAAGTRINRKGGVFANVDYLADANPATATCELDATVDCSAVGNPVVILIDGAASSVTALCVADATSSLGGRATLRGLVLSSSQTAHMLVARQTAFGLTGTSAPLAIQADCVGPSLAITTPICGGWVDASDDVSPNAGIQTQVVVNSPNTPQVDATLSLVRASGTSTVVTGFASMLSPGATDYSFSALDFGTSGVVRMVATALDPFGNSTVTGVCSVTVARSPFITLTPLATTTFGAGNLAAYDCRPSTAGLDLAIGGTTSATNGSNVTVQIGGALPVVTTVVGGGYSACAPAPNGSSNVFASVTDGNGLDGVSGTASAAPIAITVNGVGQ